MIPEIKAFGATLLVTAASLFLLFVLALKLYGEHANLSLALAMGSCIGVVTHPIFKRRFQKRANP